MSSFERMRLQYQWSRGAAPISNIIKFKVKKDRKDATTVFHELELSQSQLIIPLNNEIKRISLHNFEHEKTKVIRRGLKPLVKFNEAVSKSCKFCKMLIFMSQKEYFFFDFRTDCYKTNHSKIPGTLQKVIFAEMAFIRPITPKSDWSYDHPPCKMRLFLHFHIWSRLFLHFHTWSQFF